MPTIEYAIRLATKAHEGQVDKVGDPYIMHPLRVMERVRTGYIPYGVSRETAMIVAVMHDVLEDTDVTVKDLMDEGFNEFVITSLLSVTKVEGEKYMDLIHRALHNPTGRVVKYHDICDNSDPVRLFMLDEETRDRLIKKYNTAKALF